jgi:hypothetical protein
VMRWFAVATMFLRLTLTPLGLSGPVLRRGTAAARLPANQLQPWRTCEAPRRRLWRQLYGTPWRPGGLVVKSRMVKDAGRFSMHQQADFWSRTSTIWNKSAIASPDRKGPDWSYGCGINLVSMTTPWRMTGLSRDRPAVAMLRTRALTTRGAPREPAQAVVQRGWRRRRLTAERNEQESRPRMRQAFSPLPARGLGTLPTPALQRPVRLRLRCTWQQLQGREWWAHL